MKKPLPTGFKLLPMYLRKRNLNKVIEDAKSKVAVAQLCCKYADQATGVEHGDQFFMAHMCVTRALSELQLAIGYVNRGKK